MPFCFSRCCERGRACFLWWQGPSLGCTVTEQSWPGSTAPPTAALRSVWFLEQSLQTRNGTEGEIFGTRWCLWHKLVFWKCKSPQVVECLGLCNWKMYQGMKSFSNLNHRIDTLSFRGKQALGRCSCVLPRWGYVVCACFTAASCEIHRGCLTKSVDCSVWKQLGDPAAQTRVLMWRDVHYRTLLWAEGCEWQTWSLSYPPF